MNVFQFADRHPVWTLFYLLAVCVTTGWCAHHTVDMVKWWTRR